MERIQLTKDLSLSRIIQGFWRLDKWNLRASDLGCFISNCIDRGVTSLDTAEIYANADCEKQIGHALATDPSLRNRIEIVTKGGIYRTMVDGQPFGYYDTHYDRIMQSCEDSLKRLQCDHIDLYLIHREDPCIDHPETARALKDLKQKGYIREAGVSNFDPFKFDALDHHMDGTLCTNQIEWNPTAYEPFQNGMMDYLGKKGLHPMIWSPLAGGKLFTSDEPIYANARKKIQEIAARHQASLESIVYAWIMYHPTKPLPISGSSKLERLDQAIAALTIRLDHSEWFEIYAASGQQEIR